MGHKTQGGFWCDFCGSPVAGEKTTHRARGAAGILAAGVTGGLSLLATVPGRYHCPNCGGHVRTATAEDYERLQAQTTGEPTTETPGAMRQTAPPAVEWREGPAENVPPWRQRDRARLDRSPAQATGSAPQPDDLAERLDRLAALHASGALTDEEFAAAKQRLIECG